MQAERREAPHARIGIVAGVRVCRAVIIGRPAQPLDAVTQPLGGGARAHHRREGTRASAVTPGCHRARAEAGGHLWHIYRGGHLGTYDIGT